MPLGAALIASAFSSHEDCEKEGRWCHRRQIGINLRRPERIEHRAGGPLTYLSHKIIRDLFHVENTVDRGRVFALGSIHQHCPGVSGTALIMTPPEIKW